MWLTTGRALQDYPKGNEESSSIATGPGVASNNRPTSSKLKESASGVKGLAAAVHGAGEMIRGNINAGVDRAFNDVCILVTFPLADICLGTKCRRA